MAQQQESLRAAQSEAFAAAQQLTRARNEINALDLQKQGNVVRLEKLSSEKIQLEEERARLNERLEEFATSVEAVKLNARTTRGTVEERQQRLREVQQQLAQITQELDGFLTRQAEEKSRLDVLEQLDTSHEGLPSCTCSTPASSPSSCRTRAGWISPSPSPACSPRG
jgi:chromosome segregation ATPase